MIQASLRKTENAAPALPVAVNDEHVVSAVTIKQEADTSVEDEAAVVPLSAGVFGRRSTARPLETGFEIQHDTYITFS